MIINSRFHKETSHHHLFRRAFCCVDVVDASAKVTRFKTEEAEQKETTCARRYLNYSCFRNHSRETQQLSPCWRCLRVWSPRLTLLPINGSSSNPPRPSRLSTSGKSRRQHAQHPMNCRLILGGWGGSQRLWQRAPATHRRLKRIPNCGQGAT